MFENLVFFFIALGISILAMASGGEGSILFIPAFIWAGVSTRWAVGTAYVTQFVGKSAGTASWYLVGVKEGKQVILWRALLFIVPICLAFVAVGAVILDYLPADHLKLAFGLIAIVLAVIMVFDWGEKSRKDVSLKELGGTLNIVLFILAGLFTGLIAIGAGTLTMFVLHHRSHLKIKRSVATAVALLPFAASIGLLVHMQFVSYEFAVFTIPGVIIGGLAGPWIAKWLDAKGWSNWIKAMFIVLTMVSGCGMTFLAAQSIF